MHGNSPENMSQRELNHWIPSNVTVSSELIQEVLSHLRDLGWGDHDAFGIHMALEEALMNAIKHGNQLDESKKVEVRGRICTQRLEIQVTDEGPGFDPQEVPDPTAEENLDKPSGRGLLLMRTFMESVEFNPKGNSVSMHKQKSISDTDAGADDDSVFADD